MGIIEAKDLVHEYIIRDEEGNVESIHTALDHMDLSVEAGQFIAVLGHNGSGKSTFAKHLNALLTPSEGTLIVDGMDVSDESLTYDIRQEAGMVFQNPDNQIVTDKVWHELAFGLESLGMDQKTIRLRVAEMASYFGIQGWFHKNVTELSGGQKQRVSLARVLALSPPVLLMDEPFAALDAITREQMQLLLVTLHARIGMGIILVTHDVEEALLLGDEVCVMAPGQGIVASRRVEVPRTGDVTDRKLLRELKTILRQSMAGQGGPLLLS